MKIIKSILIAFILLLGFSCTEAILEKEPKSSFSAQGFYETRSDAQAGVYGIYDALQSALRINFSFWGEGRADAVDTRHSGDPLVLKQNTLSQTISSASWNNLYRVISRANYAIEFIPDVFDANDELGQELMGQARALRALAYFYAVRVWGDVPLITEPYLSVAQNVFVTRTDKQLVLDQIVEDLQFAAENCAVRYGGERDRILITQGAANALLVKVLMWQHQYEEALAASEKVLSNSMYSLVSINDWNSIFTTGYSNESVFEVGYDEIQTNALRVLYAIGSDSHYFPSVGFRNAFEEDDLRKDLIYDVTEEEPRKIWKFFGEGFNDESSDPSSNNIVVVRLADILLYKAEAHYHQGEITEALEALNRIRHRAGLPTMTEELANSLYGGLESAILHERAVELCFEGHRWFDLVRTGNAIKVMEPINGLNSAANFVWPIHEDALNRNPNLVQNPFYE